MRETTVYLQVCVLFRLFNEKAYIKKNITRQPYIQQIAYYLPRVTLLNARDYFNRSEK
jgi:hypothetical protein